MALFQRVGEKKSRVLDLLMQRFDLEFGFLIDLEIFYRTLAIDVGQAVLTHHDDGRCIGGLK